MTLQSSVPAASPEQSAPSHAKGLAPTANPIASSALPKPGRVPSAKRGGNRGFFLLGSAAVVAVMVLGAGAVWYFWLRGPAVRADLVTAKVEYKDLQLKIVERGTLEAKENRDVKCEVKTGSRGAPKIRWVVDNGALVKKGDLLVEIDDSYLQEQATNQKILRDNAESAKITAEQNYPIAQNAIGLAEQNAEKWIKGDFPQQLHDLEGQIQTSESNLLQEEDRMAWVARMVKKSYMTASQEQAEEAQLMGDKLDLQKKQELKKVLIDYTDPVTRQTNENALKTAKNNERAAYATMLSARAVFEQQDGQYKDLLEQIKQCHVIAEHSGIVVYSVPEQTRMGSGATQSIIAQGEPVQYGQKMMSIPDLSHMLVNVRIHEAFINHMEVQARVESVNPDGPAEKAGFKTGDIVTKVGNKAVKGYTDLVDAIRSYKPGAAAKVTVQRGQEEQELDVTLAPRSVEPPVNGGGNPPTPGTNPTSPSPSAPIGNRYTVDPNHAFGVQFQEGLPANVRVEAVAGKTLRAHVKSVANVAAQQDWMSPDVKVYQAYVEIDEDVQYLKLKPGLSAVSTIFTETKAEKVLAVPVQAILSPLEKGGKPRCFVVTTRGTTEPREVELGMKDEMYAEVKSGLQDGEEVVLNPRTLLSDKEKKATKEDEKALQGGKPGGKSGAQGMPGAGGSGGGRPSGAPGGPGQGGGQSAPRK